MEGKVDKGQEQLQEEILIKILSKPISSNKYLKKH